MFFIVYILKSLKSGLMYEGPVVELVDTRDLGSRAERCEGSSPFRPTKKILIKEMNIKISNILQQTHKIL